MFTFDASDAVHGMDRVECKPRTPRDFSHWTNEELWAKSCEMLNEIGDHVRQAYDLRYTLGQIEKHLSERAKQAGK